MSDEVRSHYPEPDAQGIIHLRGAYCDLPLGEHNIVVHPGCVIEGGLKTREDYPFYSITVNDGARIAGDVESGKVSVFGRVEGGVTSHLGDVEVLDSGEVRGKVTALQNACIGTMSGRKGGKVYGDVLSKEKDVQVLYGGEVTGVAESLERNIELAINAKVQDVIARRAVNVGLVHNFSTEEGMVLVGGDISGESVHIYRDMQAEGAVLAEQILVRPKFENGGEETVPHVIVKGGMEASESVTIQGSERPDAEKTVVKANIVTMRAAFQHACSLEGMVMASEVEFFGKRPQIIGEVMARISYINPGSLVEGDIIMVPGKHYQPLPAARNFPAKCAVLVGSRAEVTGDVIADFVHVAQDARIGGMAIAQIARNEGNIDSIIASFPIFSETGHVEDRVTALTTSTMDPLFIIRSLGERGDITVRAEGGTLDGHSAAVALGDDGKIIEAAGASITARHHLPTSLSGLTSVQLGQLDEVKATMMTIEASTGYDALVSKGEILNAAVKIDGVHEGAAAGNKGFRSPKTDQFIKR